MTTPSTNRMQSVGHMAARDRGPLRPANDDGRILRASLWELRAAEARLLSDLACGDIDDRGIWSELQLVRRSIAAAGRPPLTAVN